MKTIEGFPYDATFGDLLRPAMEVKTKKEATDFFNRLVRYNMKRWKQSKKKATEVIRVNVGYFAGYYDTKTMNRVHELYGFGHPILG